MEKQELPAAGDETVATECTYGGCRTNDGGHDAPPCFDCSICLEPAGEPVVTLCGHLYCRPCVRQWLRSGWPGAQICPVCNAAVSEDRLVPLYGHDVDRRRNDGDGDGELRFDVRYSMDCIQNQHGQHYGAGAMDHRGWVLHSNAGRIIGSAAVAVLPWAFPGGRLPLPPRLVIASNDGQWQRRVENSLHQIWLFLAVSALLCFLLF